MGASSGRRVLLERQMKQRILVLAETYLPGYLAGGPVRSLANIVARLGDEFSWKIVTSDRDLHSDTPYPDIATNQWVRLGKADVFYASQDAKRPQHLCTLLRNTPHDLMYLNSFFSPRFSVLPVLARWLGRLPLKPVMLAPRGEFSAGACSLKSWKKAPFVSFARQSGAYRNIIWHASAAHEADDIRRVMGAPASRIRIVGNLAASITSSTDVVTAQRSGALSVCFLSRISRMKNLDFALRVLAKVRQPVEFTIYGPKEDIGYWAECEAIIGALPPHVCVRYAGILPNENVTDTLRQHELFFLPTRGENFGHVLVEAWSAGLPVLISDQTPWHGLAELGVGSDLSLSEPAAFVNVIETLATSGSQRGAEQRQRCLAFASSITSDEDLLEANRRLFLCALSDAAHSVGTDCSHPPESL